MRRLRVLLLTLGDCDFDQQLLNEAVARLNDEHTGTAALELRRWTAGFYPRDPAFQAQLRELDCGLILGIFHVRAPVELPPSPERMSDGSLYPSNTPYEVLAALADANPAGLPPVHIFRHPAPARAEAAGARAFDIEFHEFASPDDFERQVNFVLRGALSAPAVPPPAAESGFAIPEIVEPMAPAAPAPPAAPVAPATSASPAVPASPAIAAARAAPVAPAVIPVPKAAPVAPAPETPQQPFERRQRLALVAAGVFAVLALAAGGDAFVEHRRARREAERAALLNERLTQVESRDQASARRLDETGRDLDTARSRLRLADDLVIAMVHELAAVLRPAEGMPPAAIRQAVGRLDQAMAPVFARGGDDPDIVVAHAGILGQFAQVYAGIGDDAEGRKLAEQAVAMLRKLADKDKANDEFRRDLSLSLRMVGGAALRSGDDKGAATAFQEAIAVGRTMQAETPPAPAAPRELMSALVGLGDTKTRGGDYGGALPLYEEAATLVRRLADAEPRNPEWTRGIAVLLSKVGDAKAHTGDRDGALTAFQQALVVQREVSAAAPDEPEPRRYIAIILGRIGDLREDAGDPEGALAAHNEGLTIRRNLAAEAPDSRQAQLDLAVGLYKVAVVTTGDRRRKSLQEALAILQKLDRQAKLNDEQNALVKTIRQALTERR